MVNTKSKAEQWVEVCLSFRKVEVYVMAPIYILGALTPLKQSEITEKCGTFFTLSNASLVVFSYMLSTATTFPVASRAFRETCDYPRMSDL